MINGLFQKTLFILNIFEISCVLLIDTSYKRESVCFSLVCFSKAQKHRSNAVFLFGEVTFSMLEKCVKYSSSTSTIQ
mgnify:CR=1 FL=1